MSCSHVVENLLFRALERRLGFALPNLTFLITKKILNCVGLSSGEIYSKGLCAYLTYARTCQSVCSATEKSFLNARQGQQTDVNLSLCTSFEPVRVSSFERLWRASSWS